MSYYDYKGDEPDVPELPEVFEDAELAAEVLGIIIGPTIHGLESWLKRYEGLEPEMAKVDNSYAEDVFGCVRDALMLMEDAESLLSTFADMGNDPEYLAKFEPDPDTMREQRDDI